MGGSAVRNFVKLLLFAPDGCAALGFAGADPFLIFSVVGANAPRFLFHFDIKIICYLDGLLMRTKPRQQSAFKLLMSSSPGHGMACMRDKPELHVVRRGVGDLLGMKWRDASVFFSMN